MWLAVLLTGLLTLVACGAEPLPDYQSAERSYPSIYVPQNGNTPDGAEHARGLLAKDPRREALTDAWVRDDQILGVVLRPGVEGETLREIMLQLALGMASAFPNRDVEAIAYNEVDKRTVARAVYRVDTGETSYESVR
ncbi:MAG: hypothetical protein M3Q29_00860 [Chloroflexota bacterium]|nr:hypothetical protein [Chloroflexota bacterium]